MHSLSSGTSHSRSRTPLPRSRSRTPLRALKIPGEERVPDPGVDPDTPQDETLETKREVALCKLAPRNIETWENFPEYLDYKEIITFDDSNTKGRTESKIVDVSKEMELLLHEN